MATLTPIITGTPGQPPTYNTGMAETFSWIPVNNDANRPLFAKATYEVNIAGQSGFDYISANTISYGEYTSVLVVSSAKFQSLTATNSNVGELTAITLPVGFSFSGPIKGIQLSFGSLIAYK